MEAVDESAEAPILVVDDEPMVREVLAQYLVADGFDVVESADGDDAIAKITELTPQLVLLDLMLPKRNGLEVLRFVRQTSQLPVILLTAMAEETDRVVGLEIGADDYLTKPFNPRELLARIKAVLRRAHSLPPGRDVPASGDVRFDRWTLNLDRRELVDADGVVTPLSTGEFRLLAVFVEHPGRVLSRDQLLDLTRGRAAAVFDRSIDNQVSRLRRKIERDPRNPSLIKTVWGGGYSFIGEVERP